MTSPGTSQSRLGGRILLAAVLLVVAVGAVLLGREGSPINMASKFQPNTVVSGVIGSEKRPFFEDPEVIKRLDKLGYEVNIETAGSRRIATDVDLEAYDFSFPSSSPSADKIARDTNNRGTMTPFHSPMAVATFTPILESLEAAGVAVQQGEQWVIDMEKYVDLASSGTRWRDLEGDYASPRNVQIASTDIRTSNSAAMYLAILAWVVQGGAIATDDDIDRIVSEVSPLFTGQGYTESSSSGPFGDYLSHGMSSKPMTMVYEAQFLGEAMAPSSRLAPAAELAYLSPTVVSNHTVVSFTAEGEELGRLLTEDPELQRLAAHHGFRPSGQGVFNDVLAEAQLSAPPDLVDVVDPPSYDVLEELIEGVGVQYTSPDPPLDQEEEAP